VSIESSPTGPTDWFKEHLTKVVGDGNNTGLWSIRWLDNFTLKESFPCLFQIIDNKDALILQVCYSVEQGMGWSWNWRRPFFQWEQQSLEHLLSLLQWIQFCHNK